MPIRVGIPQVNKWDVEGGVRGILKATDRYANSQDPLVLDLARCSFLSAEATALLASIFLVRRKMEASTQIDSTTVQWPVWRHLQRMWFFSLSGIEEKGIAPGSSLPLFHTEALEKDRILRYIDEEILGRPAMPSMTPSLRKEIRRAFFEVIGNVFHHSGSLIGAVVCGQIYPNDNEIQITFLDRGVGVACKVRSWLDSIEDDKKAIDWALKRGTSTLATGTQSRGLGLYLLREFIKANEGQFRVYANGAFLEEASGRRTYRTLNPPLGGTLVDLRINIRPDVEYGFQQDFEN
ncbi:MAG: sensor histidine kinase [Candidatus Tectomicrobia bacterium]|uniref:Sensor histidine kinase n=1 Tax=Tectimicrobiota bacterium TaxID=2528274 RepID=A0A932GR85_UNCTE|nr:sensor histidine kinase [Candidatus Tectomicrobia bacterium]